MSLDVGGPPVWPFAQLRDVLRRTRWGTWLVRWTNPLHIARKSLHDAVAQRADRLHGQLLDIGCGYQPYRHLFRRVSRHVGMDLPGAGVIDVYGDAMALPFRDGAFDSVLCNEVLEHVPEPAEVMREIARVLRPGGTLILTTPQTWGLHLEPHDFFRYTKYGLRYLSERSGLEVQEVAPTCGMWSTLVQRFVDTVVHTYGRRWPRFLTELVAWWLAPLTLTAVLLDMLVGRRGDTIDNVLVARRRPA